MKRNKESIKRIKKLVKLLKKDDIIGSYLGKVKYGEKEASIKSDFGFISGAALSTVNELVIENDLNWYLNMDVDSLSIVIGDFVGD